MQCFRRTWALNSSSARASLAPVDRLAPSRIGALACFLCFPRLAHMPACERYYLPSRIISPNSLFCLKQLVRCGDKGLPYRYGKHSPVVFAGAIAICVFFAAMFQHIHLAFGGMPGRYRAYGGVSEPLYRMFAGAVDRVALQSYI